MITNFNYRTIIITTILVYAFIFSCLETFAASNFEIKHADSLQADKEEIILEGNIIINYKDAAITAPKGTVKTDENGKPNKAIFSGRAKLKLKDRDLEADKLTISLNDKIIYLEGNTHSELKDKKNNSIIITSDYQELNWSGEDAHAEGNLKAKYKDTEVSSDKAKIIYKNKKPEEAIFYGSSKQSLLIQPTSKTFADEFIFSINTEDVKALGNIKSTIWPDKTKLQNEQDPVVLNADDLFIDQNTGTITAKGNLNKVIINYQDTHGESNKALLFREKETRKPEKIIFAGGANVTQIDKQLSSEEVLFNFKDKKLTSNTKTSIRPKTLIFKKN